MATAYYLAKEFKMANIAVLEKGWIGSGNVGRNTTIVRSNYMLPENNPFYEMSMKLWENLEQDFNYNAMMSQRGILNLFHSDAERDAAARRGNAMALSDADAVLLDREGVRKMCPFWRLTTSASRSKADCCNPVQAQRATMRWLGAMRAVRINVVWTSSKIAKSRVFKLKTGCAAALKPPRETSRLVRLRFVWPDHLAG